MKKRLITLLTAMTVLCTSIPVFASTSNKSDDYSELTISETAKTDTEADLENFLSSDIAQDFHVKKLDKLPSNAKVLKFDNWDEASEFLKSAQAELNDTLKNTKNESINYSSNPGIDLGTDYYAVGSFTLPSSGTGTITKEVDWDVPGASAQTVYSTHSFDYSNNKVTNSSRGSYISGLGISTWNQYYSGLTHPSTKEWNSIIKGKWGYYLSVGGQNVGASSTVGLLSICTAK